MKGSSSPLSFFSFLPLGIDLFPTWSMRSFTHVLIHHSTLLRVYGCVSLCCNLLLNHASKASFFRLTLEQQNRSDDVGYVATEMPPQTIDT